MIRAFVPVPRGGEAGQVHCRRQGSRTSAWASTDPTPRRAFPATSGSSGSSTPRRPIHLREGGREEILDALFQEELDVIVVPDYDLELDQRFDVLELNSERAKFMTGPHTPLAGRQYVSPEELVGQTIFRVEGLSEDPQGHPLPDYFVRLGLGENPVQRVKTYLEATILVQAGLGIAAIPGGMEGKLARDVSVFSIEGDSFRIRTVALRLLPPVSVAADHFFQVIRQDPERVKQGV